MYELTEIADFLVSIAVTQIVILFVLSGLLGLFCYIYRKVVYISARLND